MIRAYSMIHKCARLQRPHNNRLFSKAGEGKPDVNVVTSNATKPLIKPAGGKSFQELLRDLQETTKKNKLQSQNAEKDKQPTNSQVKQTTTTVKSAFSFDPNRFGAKPVINGAKPLTMGSSIRDSFRKVERQTTGEKFFLKEPINNSKTNTNNRTFGNNTARPTAQDVRVDVLKNEEEALFSQVQKEIDNDPEVITEGELRYQRYQRDLAIKKAAFQSTFPVDDRTQPTFRQPPKDKDQKNTAHPYPNGPMIETVKREPVVPAKPVLQYMSEEDAEQDLDEFDEQVREVVRPPPTETPVVKPFVRTQELQVVDVNDLKASIEANIQKRLLAAQNTTVGQRPKFKKQSKFKEQVLSEVTGSYQQMLLKKGPPVKNAKKFKPKLSVTVKEVTIPFDGIRLRDLASQLSLKIESLLRILADLDVDVNVTKTVVKRRGKKKVETDIEDKIIDADVAELLVQDLGAQVKRIEDVAATQEAKPSTLSAEDHAALKILPRAPIVCVMGHVDHGKTTLMDALRNIQDDNKVAGAEAGGITQKLSAFSVTVNDNKQVVFLDTPGHAAFSAMRTYGALATDLVVLVVAVDDGVRPQTIEAINIALEAKCNIIVALNKIDKIVDMTDRKRARNRVLTQLIEYGIVAEEFQGDVQVVECSGKSGEGVSTLVDSLLLQADVLELSAATAGQAEAVVLDAHYEKGRGVVADVLVKWGCLSVGDPVVVGSTYGRVKSMTNDKGKKVDKAYPSDSVRVMGFKSIPTNGQEMLSVATEERAKEIVERRQKAIDARLEKEEEDALALRKEREAVLAKASGPPKLDAKGKPIIEAVEEVKLPTVHVLLKADGVGTVEALNQIVKGVASRLTEAKVHIVSSGVGDIIHKDVEMAADGQCLILGFNVKTADAATRSASKEADVKIVTNDVIYRLEEELIAAVQSIMPQERILHTEGTAKVLKVFPINDKKKTVVAGLSVLSGKIRTQGVQKYMFRVMRNGEPVLDDFMNDVELFHFKDKVHEIESGNECGLSLEKFTNYQEGDEIHCFRVEHKQKQLDLLSGVSGAVKSQSLEFDRTSR